MGPPGRKPGPPSYPPTPVLPPSQQGYQPHQSGSNTFPRGLHVQTGEQNFEPPRRQPNAIEHEELPSILQDESLDTVDGRGGARLRIGPERVNVNFSYERAEAEVNSSTPGLLTSFIVNRMENDGYDVPIGLRQRRVESEVAQVLQKIGDDLHQNTHLNSLISEIQVTPQTAYKTFAHVASEIFKDGVNWGRIVTLFYFAYKLALQSLKSIDLIDLIISWVTKFVSEKLARWIAERGGWQSVREYFGSTTVQLVGVFLAGLCVATAFNWWWRR